MVRLRILVVDDEPGIRDTLADILELHGFAAATARDGAEAVDKVRNEDREIDVVLMDFKMPGMNGVEAFRRIRRLRPSVKVVFITAYQSEFSVAQLASEGSAGVCYKPLNIPELLRTIETAANR